MNEKKIGAETRFNSDKANAYDENIMKVIPGYQTSHELARCLLEDTLSGSSNILVAGCGTGKEILDYAINNLQWQFLGFDPSEKMLSTAKERVQANKCAERVHLVKGVIDDVHETDFDAATSILVLPFLPSDDEIQGFFNKISTKLKPSAPLVLVYLEGDKKTDEYLVLNSAWKTQQLSTRNDDQSVIEEFKQRDKDMRYISQEQIELFLNKAGFSKPLKFYQAYLLTGQIVYKK